MMPGQEDLLLASARSALIDGHFQSAMAYCNSVLDSRSGSEEAAYIMGLVHLREGRLLEAYSWFERANSNGKCDAEFLGNFGEVLRLVGKTEVAREILEKSVRDHPEHAASKFNLALLYQSEGEMDSCKRILISLLPEYPDKAQVHYLLFTHYYEERNFKKSLEHMREAIESLEHQGGIGSPMHRAWRLENAGLMLSLGDPLNALGCFSDAEVRETLYQGKTLARAKSRAKCQFELGRESAAIELLNEVANGNLIRQGQSREFRCARILRVSEWCERNSKPYQLLTQGSRFDVPAPNVIAGSSPVESHSHSITMPVEEIFLARLEEVIVLADQRAILTSDSALLLAGVVEKPLSFPVDGVCVIHCSEDNRVLLELPNKRISLDGPTVLLDAENDLYAWLCALARLWAIGQANISREVQLCVSDAIPDEWISMLQELGYSKNQVIVLPSDATLELGILVVVSRTPRADCLAPVAIQYLRRNFHTRSNTNRRLYVLDSRGNSSRISNGIDVERMLRSNGFEVLDVKGSSLRSLIDQLSGASVLIAMEGELPALLTFLPQGSIVGAIACIRPSDLRTCYMSTLLGQRLTYLFGTPDYSKGNRIEDCPLTLDIRGLRSFLESTVGC